MSAMSKLSSDIAACPGLPLGDEGPVFAAPWQAQIFALVVALHERGLFPWRDFQAALIDAIAAAPLAEQGADFYYRHWLRAAETLFQRLGLIAEADLLHRIADVEAAALAAHRPG
jgi:nitrile hydratase accessory protein